MQDNIPVYVMTGFLDGGKTSFLKFTLSQDYFNDGSKTLIILTEEGEVEFEPEFLKKYNCVLEVLEEDQQLNEVYLRSVGKKHKPDRVIIEYNGMWSPKEIPELGLPLTWELYQTITILDGSTYQLYVNNVKNLAIELLTYTDMVVFNRCTDDTPIESFNRSLKAVNRNAEVMFQDKDGNEIEAPIILPYDIESDEITVEDDDFGIFYIDLQERPELYENKTVCFKGQVMKSRNFEKDCFVPGRQIMTCCEADIRFLGYLCRFEKAEDLKKRSWVNVKAVIRMEENEVYEGEGPVLHAISVEPSSAPQKEVIGF